MDLPGVKDEKVKVIGFISDGYSVNKCFAREYLFKLNQNSLFAICGMHLINRIIDKSKDNVSSLKTSIEICSSV